MLIFQITEIKAGQYESEKSFRLKIADITKKSDETIETLQVSQLFNSIEQDNNLTHYQTTNFRLFQTENLIILNLMKMAESYPNG